jgi:hypothetical protein
MNGNNSKDDDDLRDDEDDGSGGTSAGFILVAIALAVLVFAVASGIGAIKSTQSTPPGVPTCTTSCYGFVKLECPGDRFMDACFGFWGCGNPATNHPCGTNP